MKIDKLYEMVNGILYSREIPKEAEEFAKENGFVVIVGGSDDLMYAYGAKSWLTEYCEHGYGWDGETFEDIDDKCLQKEANQLGLQIYWCGLNRNMGRRNYITDESGAFSYSVKEGIEFKEFLVYEDENRNSDEVYCTGIIIELPKDFIPSEDCL